MTKKLDIGSSILTAINIYVDDDVFVIKTTEDSHQYLRGGVGNVNVCLSLLDTQSMTSLYLHIRISQPRNIISSIIASL